MAGFAPIGAPVLDYEALKEQWSDIEDRDGIRLSWNTFPSSRMVSAECRVLSAEYCVLRAFKMDHPELT